jgi:hypothetical protein
MPPSRKKRAAARSPKAAPRVVVPAVAAADAAADAEEAPPAPVRPARGMTTEQIRRVGNQIAEHERDLKNSTSRR